MMSKTAHPTDADNARAVVLISEGDLKLHDVQQGAEARDDERRRHQVALCGWVIGELAKQQRRRDEPCKIVMISSQAQNLLIS